MQVTSLDRYRGAMLGLAAGDALGTTLEFTKPGAFTPITSMVGGGPFNLKPGELSDVIETPQAFFLMLVEDKRTAHVKPITEVREEIEGVLVQQERTRLEAKYIEKLKKKTFICKFDY